MKVAVVTGASSGIGRAIARHLGREGFRVVLGGRTRDLLEETASEIRADGSDARALVVDVRRESDVESLVETATSAFGPLDVLVNNAAVDYAGPAFEGDAERWREMLETNVLAVLVGCREAVRAMAGRGGTIVNVSSLAATGTTPGDAVYCATKHAVNAFSECLRAEIAGSGIRVLVVQPGQTMTSIGRHLPHARVQELALALGYDPATIPDFTGRHVPRELAERVLRDRPDRFLAPDDVARAVVRALATQAETITIRPGESEPGA